MSGNDPRRLLDYLLVDEDIERMLLESGGEVTPEIERAMAAWGEDRDRKVDRYVALIRRKRARQAELRERIVGLQHYLKAEARAEESLTTRLLEFLRAQGLDRIDTPTERVRVVPSSRPSIHYDGDLSRLPPEYVRHPEPVLDRQTLQQALDHGLALPEGVVVTRSHHLRIL